MFSPRILKFKNMNEKELKELLENLLKKGECEYIEFKKNYNLFKDKSDFLNIIQPFQILQHWWEKILAI